MMVFSVGGMHCASCGLLVDDVVGDLPGVIRSATDVNAGRTVVTTREGAVVEPGVVVEAITELGYAARLIA
jgi:Cu+-exporting ATPase